MLKVPFRRVFTDPIACHALTELVNADLAAHIACRSFCRAGDTVKRHIAKRGICERDTHETDGFLFGRDAADIAFEQRGMRREKKAVQLQGCLVNWK